MLNEVPPTALFCIVFSRVVAQIRSVFSCPKHYIFSVAGGPVPQLVRLCLSLELDVSANSCLPASMLTVLRVAYYAIGFVQAREACTKP